MKDVTRPLVGDGPDEFKVLVGEGGEVEGCYEVIERRDLPPRELSGSGEFMKKPTTFITLGLGRVSTLYFVKACLPLVFNLLEGVLHLVAGYE